MAQTFSLFVTGLVGWNLAEMNHLLGIENGFFFHIVQAIIMVGGIVTLLAFNVNLQGLSSSKNSLRERCVELERELGDGTYGPKYWQSIQKRRKYLIETHMKPYSADGRRELRAGGYTYVTASTILLFAWTLFSVIVIFFGLVASYGGLRAIIILFLASLASLRLWNSLKLRSVGHRADALYLPHRADKPARPQCIKTGPSIRWRSPMLTTTVDTGERRDTDQSASKPVDQPLTADIFTETLSSVRTEVSGLFKDIGEQTQRC
jgi:hypothetical protein